MNKNPLMMLFPIDKAEHVPGFLKSVGRFIAKIFFEIKYDLQKSNINYSAGAYCLASLFSALIYSFVFLFIGMVFGVLITRTINSTTIMVMLVFSIMAFFGAMTFHLSYPKIASKQLAGLIEQDLLFALRTMLIQISSGTSLFETIKSISKSNYGQVSKEFELVVKDINSGMSETKALERLAFKTKSEVLKKTIWQIITTLKSGGSLTNALHAQVDSLVEQQRESIKRYSAELNLWTLIYLIVAAALPSLGVTFLVIASSISGGGIGQNAVIAIVLIAFLIQGGLILLVRAKVPKVIK
ncbi:MAG: hypothetical protein GX950_01425 [Candidatus Diapherotrites archaeon]|uniref:Type II secretion system protein GspF domain-containing protein n=1 Tax=Candidatus Iainarchaeum sp. TaxID=3101447 RepID=A0A7K4BYX0_9ARCH|nr:hypothetical protein [Candidatus Diapherotrites archaeon]